MTQFVYPHIVETLRKRLVGQEEALHELAVLGELYTRKLYLQRESGDVESTFSYPNLNIFMTGPTGTGKTFMLSMLAQCLNVPFVRIDCSSLTAPGYQGADILDFLKDLGGVAGAVIMLDELDKLALKGSDSFNAYAMSAQAQLLDLLEGRYSGDAKEGNKHYSFYPATWLVVCAGSFQSSVKAERELNSTKHGMGFHGTKAPEPPQDPRSILRESGLMPELIGRIVRVIETKRLTKEQIIELMLRKDDSSYSKYRKVYQQLRLNIKEIEEIADKVLKSPSGLRELDSLIFNEICNHMASFKSWDNNTNRSGK